MVVKRSEYQNQYKSSIAQKHQAIYLENLQLRHQRRDREFIHTPICWGGSSEEEVGSDSNPDEKEKEAKSREPEEQYQSLAEILSDAREKAEAIRKKKTEDQGKPTKAVDSKDKEKHVSVSEVPAKVPSSETVVSEVKNNNNNNCDVGKKNVGDKSYSIYDIVDEENRKLNEKLAKTYALTPEGKLREDISDQSDTDRDMKKADELKKGPAVDSEINLRKKTYTKKKSKESHGHSKRRPASAKSKSSSRPASAAYRGRACCRTPESASSRAESFVPPLSYVPRARRPDRQAPIPRARSTSVSPEPPVRERPPFVAYGAGDKEDNLATHRTHNVRSSTDVYMAALRAKIRREEQQRKHMEKIQRTKSAENMLDKLTSLTPRDEFDWESEYRKQYHGYEPRDYKRAVSARAVIPRSNPMRAVHRGGCLVVHVD